MRRLTQQPQVGGAVHFFVVRWRRENLETQFHSHHKCDTINHRQNTRRAFRRGRPVAPPGALSAFWRGAHQSDQLDQTARVVHIVYQPQLRGACALLPPHHLRRRRRRRHDVGHRPLKSTMRAGGRGGPPGSAVAFCTRCGHQARAPRRAWCWPSLGRAGHTRITPRARLLEIEPSRDKATSPAVTCPFEAVNIDIIASRGCSMTGDCVGVVSPLRFR